MALSAQVEVRGAELLRGSLAWTPPGPQCSGITREQTEWDCLSLMAPTSPGQGSLPGVGRAATQKGWGLSPSQAWLPVLPLPPSNPRTLSKPQAPLSPKK